MSDLIERLEKATGPSRELDEAIMLAVWPKDAGAVAPCFTESLDAAMGLVREGWCWSVCSDDDVSKPNGAVWPRQQPFPVELDISEDGATSALALCIAALKARGVK